MDQYAVIGQPVEHSKSPLIHRLFAEQTGQQLQYSLCPAPVDGFAHAVSEFFANGGQGMNVTVPFKQEAWQTVDDSSDAASRARAVNTIKRQANGDLYGTNTDGTGLCCDLQSNLGWSLQGARILILGAGGAVRGVLQPLLESGAELVAIHNRTAEKARQLVDEFEEYSARPKRALLKAKSAERLQGKRFDLVINATSASLDGKLPEIPETVFADGCRAYDMFYAAGDTAFMQWASQCGAAATSDGLGMLVEQAAESFQVWRDIRPDTAPVIQAVRKALLAD